jgi:hypothetical protein
MQSVGMALAIGITCLALGNLAVGALVEKRSGTKAKKPPCASSAQLAGFGQMDCEPSVRFHPMRFR